MDPLHDTFAAPGAAPEAGFVGLDLRGRGFDGAPVGRVPKQSPALGELGFTLGVSHEPIATDPDEPLGQGMQQEPADELTRLETHRPKPPTSGVVLELE